MEYNATHHLAGEGYYVTIYSDQRKTGKREENQCSEGALVGGANDHRDNTPLTCIVRGNTW